MSSARELTSLSEDEVALTEAGLFPPEVLSALKGKRMGEMVSALLDGTMPGRDDVTIREYLVGKAVAGLMSKEGGPRVGELLQLQKLENGDAVKKREKGAVELFDARLKEVKDENGK